MVAEDQINVSGAENEGGHGGKEAVKREFALRLHRAMVAKDWRQADLRRASGVAKDSISQYYNGKTLPTEYSLRKISHALGVAPDALMPGSVALAPSAAAHELGMRDFGPVIDDVPGDPTVKRIRVSRIVKETTAGTIYNMIVGDAANRS